MERGLIIRISWWPRISSAWLRAGGDLLRTALINTSIAINEKLFGIYLIPSSQGPSTTYQVVDISDRWIRVFNKKTRKLTHYIKP